MITSKRHLPARRLAWEVIRVAKRKDRQLLDILAEHLRNMDFDDEDKWFIRELVQGTVRMKGRLDWELSQVFTGDYEEMNDNLKVLLRLGAYQLRFMDGVPDYASVATSVHLAKSIHPNAAKLANALLRTFIDYKISVPDKDSTIISWSQYLSHPVWLMSKWTEQWSLDKAKEIAEWNNKVPDVWFRLNSLEMSIKDLKKYLDEHDYEYEFYKHNDLYFKVNHTSKLYSSELYDLGNIGVQDPSAGFVVDLLAPEKDETIIDGCAAPGNKTAYIAEKMENTGKILAYDSNKHRLKRLVKQITRLNVTNVEAEIRDLTYSELPKADKVLLDVPSAGTGVLGKRVDVRWRKSIDDIYESSILQRKLLWNATKYVKHGGVLVYSTNSLENEENWMVIDAFLKNQPEYKIEKADKFVPKKFVNKDGALEIYSPKHNIDGCYAIRLRRD
ncbi:MAG: 16S rRNA (cytosine(967)-C(5))-methyltransferase RsmB [Candidatus Marinimicrobia bacterium]|nr:16S rRNA (cytosine(967)-C(5))-methyltransferase RsmB [Candidatus Neomarinimicrobiota bacterium]MBL7109691.1 16S rRNA (cytosine(967)-C(5))-methyltransferase RsmB [Candidatus Neomarinimicrobiota bacterium]